MAIIDSSSCIAAIISHARKMNYGSEAYALQHPPPPATNVVAKRVQRVSSLIMK